MTGARWLLLAVALAVAAFGLRACASGGKAPAPAPASDAGAAAVAHSAADAADDAQTQQQRQAHNAAAQAALATLQRYLLVLPSGDREKIDAFWSGGASPLVPGDAAVRTVEGIATLQLRTRTPRAMGGDSPPNRFEIPVRLRATAGGQTVFFDGWYRLQRKFDGEDWEIASASVNPEIR